MPARVSEASVLQTYPFKESDLVVSFLARDLGKLRGVAKRARRPKSLFGSGLERLSQVRMSYFQNPTRELVNLDSCELIHSHFRPARQLQRRRRAGLSGGNFRATPPAARAQRPLLPPSTRRARSHPLGRPRQCLARRHLFQSVGSAARRVPSGAACVSRLRRLAGRSRSPRPGVLHPLSHRTLLPSLPPERRPRPDLGVERGFTSRCR